MVKLKQSETITIKRSKINFAAYNPRKKDKKVVEALKKNFKKVGFLGGIQWNSITGNLIGGHKRTEALDLIYDYDGTPEKDYDVKVEAIQLDEKTEKEQNIFLNNKRVQGTTDFELMAAIIEDINIEAAGLDEYDVNLIESIVPDFKMGANDSIMEDIEDLKPIKKEQEKIGHVKNLKKSIKSGISENQIPSYFTVTFKTYSEKAEYLEGLGINGDTVFITSKEFFNKLNEF